jgi:hypothetical protein
MKKHCKRIIRRLAPPVMVAMNLNPEVSLQERMAVEALRGGWATTDHFNVLADCRDMLLLAAGEKNDKSAIAACDISGVALMNMKDRYQKIKRIGATGDELQALDLLANASEDFWRRQSGGLFVDAEAALSRCRKINAEEISMRESV